MMGKARSVPFPGAVGSRVRAIRESRGLTQEAVARAARAVGLRWSRSTLAKLERGERALTVEQFLLVALALEVRPSDLIPQEVDVALSDETVLPGARIAELLTARRGVAHGVAGEATAANARTAVEVDADGDAEARAAERLGVTARDVAAAALVAWGRPLTETRDDRVRARTGTLPTDPRTLRVLRGHATRELLAELRESI